MADSGAPLLEMAGVSKSFGKVVVADSLSLRVGGGDMIGIVGPNGAGKTTLFSLISGDLAPDSGEIRIGGAAVTRQGTAARGRTGVGGPPATSGPPGSWGGPGWPPRRTARPSGSGCSSASASSWPGRWRPP